jgi:hypothetical protein
MSVSMKRGRPHPDDLKVIPLQPGDDRLHAPSNLKANEQRLFREVVASVPSNHFSASDIYLLVNFVRVTLIVDRAMKDLEESKPKDRPMRMKSLDQAIKMQSLLATKLRLTTQARADVKKLARAHLARSNEQRRMEIVEIDELDAIDKDALERAMAP